MNFLQEWFGVAAKETKTILTLEERLKELDHARELLQISLEEIKSLVTITTLAINQKPPEPE